MNGNRPIEDGGTTDVTANDEDDSRLYPLSARTMTTLFYLGLFAWAAVMLIVSLEWNWQDKLFPLLFSGFALLLIVVNLVLLYEGDRVKQFLPSTAETGSDEMRFEETGDTNPRTGSTRERYELLMIVWVITLPLALYVIGFLYTIPLYTIGFIWFFTRDLRTAVLAAAVATAMVYGLFVQVLGIRLPTGMFG
jgi:hypothetical protein